MQLYKAILKLESSLITPLKGDTIWGHVVWGVANHEGDEAVSQFLEESKLQEPSFIVSSAFPKGFICKPYPKHESRREMDTKLYSQIKKEKKKKFISASDLIDGASPPSITDFKYEQSHVMHNTINRFSNTVEDGLFSIQEMWPTSNEFDLYVLSSYSVDRVKQLLEWAFENGYGADASTGKGKLLVTEVESVKPKLHTKKYVALAPFVTDFSSVKAGSLQADTFIRTGKIGGNFATSMSPYKKTIVMFEEGAVLETEEPIQFIGNLITGIHSDKRICHSGFAPVIPIEE